MAGVWAAAPDVALAVRPKLCLVQNGENVCETEVLIQWRAPHPVSPCLYREGQAEPIACWQGAPKGSFELALIARGVEVFTLLPADGSWRAQATFEVAAVAEQYRRARRNPWSFF